ncbi:MAG TPA: response regulator [Acidimicrobiales bacterium]|nr:response regulator [Acidimicrobiales bacterium]
MPETTSAAPLTGERLDVLMVEDEPGVAWSTAEVLESAGFTVVVTKTVAEALQVVESRDVRSVILDHHVSGEYGETFLALARTHPPVIVVSALGQDLMDTFRAAHSDEVVACLAKPVPPAHLIDIVRLAVERA